MLFEVTHHQAHIRHLPKAVFQVEAVVEVVEASDLQVATAAVIPVAVAVADADIKLPEFLK